MTEDIVQSWFTVFSNEDYDKTQQAGTEDKKKTPAEQQDRVLSQQRPKSESRDGIFSHLDLWTGDFP